MRIFNEITDLIGNTPILRLKSFSASASVYAKCEFLNPFSAKDRPILYIIRDAEEAGILKPGSTIVESTSGNTGIAIAYIAATRGYHAILTMPEQQSAERYKIMKAFGAEVILTPLAEGTRGAKMRAEELVNEHPDYFYVRQHFNQSNPMAHYLSTGPEIFEDLDGKVDIFVAGIGTGGTLCGAGRFLKEKIPGVKIIAVQPAKSPFLSEGIFAPHGLTGLAPGFVPSTVDKTLIDGFENVTEEAAYRMCRLLADKEGILVGISSGAAACVMSRLASREENNGKTIVGVFTDSGQRYLGVRGLF